MGIGSASELGVLTPPIRRALLVKTPTASSEVVRLRKELAELEVKVDELEMDAVRTRAEMIVIEILLLAVGFAAGFALRGVL